MSSSPVWRILRLFILFINRSLCSNNRSVDLNGKRKGLTPKTEHYNRIFTVFVPLKIFVPIFITNVVLTCTSTPERTCTSGHKDAGNNLPTCAPSRVSRRGSWRYKGCGVSLHRPPWPRSLDHRSVVRVFRLESVGFTHRVLNQSQGL